MLVLGSIYMENKVLLGEKFLQILTETRTRLYLLVIILFLPICAIILVDFLLYSIQSHVFLLLSTIIVSTFSGWMIIYLFTTKILEINKRVSLINKSKNMASRIVSGEVKSITKEIYTIQNLSCKQVHIVADNTEILLNSLDDFDLDRLVGKGCQFIVYLNIIFEYMRGDLDE